MNRSLLKMQMIAYGLLALVLLGEWQYGEFADRLLQQQLASQPPVAYEVDALPELTGEVGEGGASNELVERPMFIEGRKPVVEGNAANTEQVVDNGQIDDWLLIGIFNKGKQPMALFSKQNEAKKFVKIAEQQSISGWLLQQIQSDRVVLFQGAQQKVVMLRKPRAQVKLPPPGVKAKPAVAAKPPVAMPPPVPPVAVPPPIPNNLPENSNDDSE